VHCSSAPSPKCNSFATKRIGARKIAIIVACSKSVGALAQALSIATFNFKSRNRVSRGAECRPFDLRDSAFDLGGGGVIMKNGWLCGVALAALVVAGSAQAADLKGAPV